MPRGTMSKPSKPGTRAKGCTFGASVLYALSGPLLWFRRRKLPAQDAAA